ncbi:hypothetical protein LEP1GSC081_3468 [Leptospira kirschneri str. H1]|uniref:Uncharacterized protein n=1 Tax=Leptospira kirschneri str. H1 TaxID=1049966 RepID=A0A0E2B2X1_9LEPT|nr:hypothetical protein LEP1GSC081_3468 [Leptospira kirschneri str. H1]
MDFFGMKLVYLEINSELRRMSLKLKISGLIFILLFISII